MWLFHSISIIKYPIGIFNYGHFKFVPIWAGVASFILTFFLLKEMVEDIYTIGTISKIRDVKINKE